MRRQRSKQGRDAQRDVAAEWWRGLEPLEHRCLLSGTTLVFHGAAGIDQIFTDDPGAPNWVNGMGDAIADVVAGSVGGSASNVARFELDINGSTFGGMSWSWSFAAGYSPGVSATSAQAIDAALDGQAIIEVDWSDVSNPIQSDNEDTPDVAALVADVLMNQLGTLGQKLLAAPIHMLGHSRGASLIGALAEDFGQRGVWVDQLTFFDPHPVSGDFGDSGSVIVADNVVFADNYWRQNGDALDLNGEPVTGAYNVNLNDSIVSNGANGTGHSNTHVWYHATIDTVGSISDGDVTIDPDALNWFAANAANPTSPRDASGFSFSRIYNNAARPSGGMWDSATRLATTVSSPATAWSSVLLDTDWSQDIVGSAGGSLEVAFDYAIPSGTSDVIVGLDVDGNPYNGNEIVGTYATASDLSGEGAASVFVPLSAAQAGQTYRLFARITSDANGKSRTDYAPQAVSIIETVDTTAPTVAALLVSSQGWANGAFLNAIDPGRGLGHAVPVGDGSQLTPLAWAGLDRIHVVFSEDVTVGQDDLLVNGVNVAEYWIGGFSYDAATFTATWTLQQAIGADKLLVDVQDTIADLAGNALDGEWDNPTDAADVSSDTYASGDGAAGGDFEFRFNVVSGDVDRSGAVSNDDIGPLVDALGLAVGAGGYSLFADVDGSGLITDADIDIAKLNQGWSLPAGEPVSTDIDTGRFDEYPGRVPGPVGGPWGGAVPGLLRSEQVRRALWTWRESEDRDGALSRGEKVSGESTVHRVLDELRSVDIRRGWDRS